MKTNENDNTSYREKALNLMEEIFGGLIIDNERVGFKNYSSKQIAEILGYDNGQYSRMINPPIGTNFSNQVYKRLIQRLEILQSNQKLTKQVELSESKIKNAKYLYTVFFSLGLFIASGLFWLLNTDTSSADQRLVLKHSERNAINKLYLDNIKMKIALECVEFNHSVRNGIYQDNLPHYLKEFSGSIPTLIEKTRNLLGISNLRAENGMKLIDLYAIYSFNEIDKNFLEVIPYLTNPQISVYDLVDLVSDKVSNVQFKNYKRLDSMVVNDVSLIK